MRQLLLALLVTATSLTSSAADLIVQLPERDALVIDVPAGWASQVRRPRPDLPPTIALSSKQPGTFQVLITPIWPMGSAGQPTEAEVRRLVEGAAQGAAAQAVESEISIQPLGGEGRAGFYFSATDRAPKPGEFANLTQGAIAFGELRITFTILSNGKPEPVRSQSLDMLRGARRSKARSAA